jgi:putative SOS response-associated peptidase YedK
MCGRFALAHTPAELTRVFDLAACVDLVPRYNIAPGTDIPVVRRSPDGTRVLHRLRWGLVPHWSKDPAIGARLLNARAESVQDKPAFRGAFQHRRCLIPADGFFEWHRQGPHKQPYFFSSPTGQVLAFGGLWESWQPPAGDLLRSVCILTTAANPGVAPIHDRMPLLLAPEDWTIWLAGTPAEAQALLIPAPEAALQSWPVSPRVNRVQEEGPDLVAPYRNPPPA